jgi:hypothetical protein
MKKKWLAVGIILLFIGVAVAPSINQSVVKASTDDDPVKKGSLPSHPLLFFFVKILFLFRLSRGAFLLNFSAEWSHGVPSVDFPLLYLRGTWLEITAIIWYFFWVNISDIMDWEWVWPGPFSS